MLGKNITDFRVSATQHSQYPYWKGKCDWLLKKKTLNRDQVEMTNRLAENYFKVSIIFMHGDIKKAMLIINEEIRNVNKN